MAYSDNFPATRPVFMADFANGGKIDPRAAFTRASTANVWDGSKHLSSDNLFLHSSTFDNAAWLTNGITKTAGQTDPAGGSNAYQLLENTTSAYHNVYQTFSGNESWSLTVYAKQNTGTRYLALRIYGAAVNNYETAVFDLAGSAPSVASGSSSGYTNVTATQTASGNGFYKCVLKATGSIAEAAIHISQNSTATGLDPYGVAGYTADGTSSIDVAFASLSTTGATDYNATTTLIHREYAPSLVSKANNVGRFDYSTDGQSVAKGILIEGAAQNLFAYSDDFANNWTKTRTIASESAAVGPTGALDADLIYADGTAGDSHHLYSSCTVTAASHTFSVYAKFAGVQYIQLQHRVTGSGHAQFDLLNGTLVDTNATGAIESVGNGWYRCSVTETQSAGTAFARIWLMGGSGVLDYNWDGDSYSGVLLYGAQYEQNSFASSYIKSNSGSATTRAAESLSVDLTQAGFNGGPVTIVSETEGGQGFYPKAFTLTDGTVSNRLTVQRESASATTSVDWIVASVRDGSLEVFQGIPSSASAGKLAVSYNTNDVSCCASGGTVATDSSAAIASGLTTLRIGTSYDGGLQLNGHCKRIAVWGEALSDTNLQALTS